MAQQIVNDFDLPMDFNPNAHDVYVDGYQGVVARNGVVRLNFYSVVFDLAKAGQNPDVSRRHALTLTLSTQTLVGVVEGLTKLVAELEKHAASGGENG